MSPEDIRQCLETLCGSSLGKGSMLLASVELKEAASMSVVTHACDPSSQETEAGVLQAKATLGCI